MQNLLIVFAFLLQICYARKVILVSLDGFRHDYLEKARSAGRNISAFTKLANTGFRAKKVQSVMVSLTFPSHFALATGRNVETHGLVGNTFWDPDMQQMYKYTDAKKNLNPEWFTKNGNEPLWLTNQRNGGKTGVFYWPGSDSRMYNEMQYTSFGLYDGTPTFRYRVDRVMDWISQPDVNFVMLYFNQPDSNGHKFGPDSKEVLDAIELTNDGIAYLMQKIENEKSFKEKPNIVVTSDHGMTRVKFDRTVNLYAVLPPDQYLFGVDGSPANMGVWPKKGGPTIATMYKQLKQLPNCDVYLKEDIPAKYHYKNNSRIAPIVVFPHLGWMILNDVNKPFKDTLNGMHGYDNFQSDMHPFLVAAGPDIKQVGMVEDFYQIDVYPLVCLLLEIAKPNKIDGEMKRVVQFLAKMPSEQYLKNFDRYTKGLQPVPGSSMVVTFNLIIGGLVVLLTRLLY